MSAAELHSHRAATEQRLCAAWPGRKRASNRAFIAACLQVLRVIRKSI